MSFAIDSLMLEDLLLEEQRIGEILDSTHAERDHLINQFRNALATLNESEHMNKQKYAEIQSRISYLKEQKELMAFPEGLDRWRGLLPKMVTAASESKQQQQANDTAASSQDDIKKNAAAVAAVIKTEAMERLVLAGDPFPELAFAKHPKKGRVVLAKQSFAVGSLVMKDTSLLVVPLTLVEAMVPTELRNALEKVSQTLKSSEAKHQSFLPLFAEYLHAAENDKTGGTSRYIAELCCPLGDIAPSAVNSVWGFAEKVFAALPKHYQSLTTADKLGRLCVIFLCNAIPLVRSGHPTLLCLFRYVSIVEHACAANTVLGFNHNPGPNGEMVVDIHASQEIQPGQHITRAYRGADISVAAFSRRQLLRTAYYFECCCSYCEQGLDRARTMKCPTCAKSTANPTVGGGVLQPSCTGVWWKCQHCNTILREDDKAGAEILRPYLEMEKRITSVVVAPIEDDDAKITAESIKSLLNEALALLHPTHTMIQLLARRLMQTSTVNAMDIQFVETVVSGADRTPFEIAQWNNLVGETYLRLKDATKSKEFFLKSFRGYKSIGLESTHDCLKAQLRAIDPMMKLPTTL